MLTRWTKGLGDEDKAELQAMLKASTRVFERLEKIIQTDLKNCIRCQESEDNYNSPSWAYKQADHIGEIRAYRKILRLINLKDKTND